MAESVHPVRAYRLRQNPPVKLRELAKRLGTTTANLSRIETGKQAVSEGLLRKLVSETGISARIFRPDLAELFAPGPGRSGGDRARPKAA